MSELHVVRLEAVASTPWRNGGGRTRELLAWPSPDDWTLRISVAEIERDGPFSAFPGVERWFAVLSGDGVRLGDPPRALSPGDPPHRFDGGEAPACRLIGGPTRDLNVMARRSRATASLRPWGRGEPWTGGDATWRGVFTRFAGSLRRDDAAEIALPAESLAWALCRGEDVWQVDMPAWAIDCRALR